MNPIDPTKEQLQNRIDLSQPIDATSVASSPSNIATLPKPQDTGEAYRNSLLSISETMASLPSTEPQETQRKSIVDRLSGLLGKATGRGQAQIQAENQAGLPEFTKQLTDINSQIKTLQNEAAAIPLQLQEQATGRGITQAGLAPIQAGELRKNAIRALGLSSIAQTLQGNIALAQQTADRAVELQFKPIEDEIKVLREQYELNKDELARVDKKRAEQLDISLKERERVLAQNKEDQKTILGFVAEASKNQAPSLLVNRALQAATPQEAISILSEFLSDPVAKQAALEDIKFRRLQSEKLQEEINIIRKEVANPKPTEAEAKKLVEQDAERKNALSVFTLADEIMNNKAFYNLAGPIRPVESFISGTETQRVNNQLKQLKAMLSLENRQKLKGSGAVSDYEAKVLESASSALGDKNFGTNLGFNAFRDEMAKIRGVAATSAGLETPVIITGPDGRSKSGKATREVIEAAVSSGYKVTYQ